MSVATPCEYTLVEKPIIDILGGFGYRWLKPSNNEVARDGLNHTLLRDVVIESLMRINDIPEEVARQVYMDLLALTDNEKWTSRLRGNLSRHVPGESTKKTIHLIDYLHPENNTFTVTNQLTVKAQKTRKPDLVVYVNGIPLVVIEAKSPLSAKDKTGEAFEQIKQYELDIPRLFYSNLFNIVTDGNKTLYGATGAPAEFWGRWRDPWPKTREDFQSDLDMAIWCLLEPSRLLDMLAHFVVFEKRNELVIKKLCRYQQYRAVNKMVQRVVDGEHSRGLIWHTQGSGKSLTMVFATLKLKSHRTVDSPSLASPNLLVVTDRIDLDTQIFNTFKACGLPNPKSMESVKKLQEVVHSGVSGLVLLSTIYKFEDSRTPVADSANWIVLVDEAHRTQEKDLGAFLRATLPDARFFGFTGTPVRKNDLDTYRNFGIEGEAYLDKYSIDDAVADGATVPIRYTSRKTDWQVDPAKIDILFDQWFANESEERIDAIKQRGITLADLVKHSQRIKLIAFDIWTHFRQHAMPDGFKAQVVAIDREAIILYKRALTEVIADHYVHEGMPDDEAIKKAEGMSVCVYSSAQSDGGQKSEDSWIQSIRDDLVKYQISGDDEKAAIKSFTDDPAGPGLLIVCSKLLTGFDAPIESVMYLDSPLKDHNLLQAIARTNRVAGPKKQYGLVVDYIGVTRKLDEALASYREEDIKNAMLDMDVLRQELKAAHKELMEFIKEIKRSAGAVGKNLKQEFDALAQALGTLDAWYLFRMKARKFIRAYEGLSPDPFVLDYSRDLKWVVGFLTYGTQHFEKKESVDLKGYSEKIRQILEEHLDATGLTTLCKLRKITDPEFWKEFQTEGKSVDDIKTAAIRKSTELKKTLREKVSENPLRFGPFSERVMAVLKRLEAGQITSAEALKEYEKIAEDLQEEGKAHEQSGLTETAYGIYRILEEFRERLETLQKEGHDVDHAHAKTGEGHVHLIAVLKVLSEDIDTLYSSDQTAPPGWHLKEQLKKELRQQVRKAAHHAGLKEIKKVAALVQDYALKFYVRVS